MIPIWQALLLHVVWFVLGIWLGKRYGNPDAAPADPDPEPHPNAEVEAAWKGTWEPLVIFEGHLDINAIKAELYDYGLLMDEATKVYDHVSGGQVSKPDAAAYHVIRQADWRVQALIALAVEEALQEKADDEAEAQAGGDA